MFLELEWWRFPVFVCETRTKGCHARCQVLCGCKPTMHYARLRIIFLSRKCLIIRYALAGTYVHITLCRHAQINTDPLWGHKQLKRQAQNDNYRHVQFPKCLVSISYIKKVLRMKPLDNVKPLFWTMLLYWVSCYTLTRDPQISRSELRTLHLRDLRFLQQCCWRCVVGWVVCDISNKVRSLTLRLLTSCIYIYTEHLFLMFLDHTRRRATVSRTPLDERSARRRDLYLTAHDTHNRQISMPPVGFKPTGGMDICLLWVSCAVR